MGYVPQGVTTKIQCTSRASVKVRDSYYTVEYSEERALPSDLTPEQVELERKSLWDTAHNQVDTQIEDILNMT